MTPYQRAVGARSRFQAPNSRFCPSTRQIERVHAPSAIARAVAARRHAILHHQLCNKLLASRAQEDASLNRLMTLHGRALDIFPSLSTVPMYSMCDPEIEQDYDFGAISRNQNLAMLVYSTAPQSAIPMDAAIPSVSPSLSPVAPDCFRPDIAVPAPISEPSSSLSQQEEAPNHPQTITPANSPAKSTPHALSMLEPANPPTVTSWSQESPASSSKSSTNSSHSILSSEATIPAPDSIASGPRLQPKAYQCFEHFHKKFSRAKREWIGSLHVQGAYVCTGRYDAAVDTPNTLCAACGQREKDMAERWTNRWASVLAWIESTTSEEQEVHPQWEGTLGAFL
ncbi:hypothetical protein QR685DRAFT_550813 [Neurospora intermedia]|uniref:Uncharacterized protein n=1 Tax=Neurospora intermedia TaxID=5142 RepID=A0ABR3DJH7_NEUIN